MRAAAALVALLLLAACAGSNESTVRLVIPRGASVRSAAESLAAHQVIDSKQWFRLRVRMSGLDRKLQPGLYEFEPRASVETVLRKLTSGDAIHIRLTLPEGATLFDLARATERKASVPAGALLAAARDSGLRARYAIPGESVEGWLRPETFDFPALVTPREILDRFLAARQSSWDSTWDRRAEGAGLTRSQLLTLASIVEAEAKLPEDRPLIAGVYLNRMRMGMPLQADPGIQYAYLLRDGARKSRLFNTDYALNSPWNTYQHPGLPPGPVGNPSNEAIEAVLAPAQTQYLYFVAGSDGAHRFSRTYQDHLNAIRKLRRERK